MAWVEANIPQAAEMRAYLDMSHADGFGQQELESLRAIEEAIDAALAKGKLEGLEILKEQYKTAWQRIRELFGQGYPSLFKRKVV